MTRRKIPPRTRDTQTPIRQQSGRPLVLPPGPEGPTGPTGPTGPAGPPGVNTWGSITGDLADQLDLFAAFNDKEPLTGFPTGAVSFSDGMQLTHDAAKLHWNDATYRLAIGKDGGVADAVLDLRGAAKAMATSRIFGDEQQRLREHHDGRRERRILRGLDADQSRQRADQPPERERRRRDRVPDVRPLRLQALCEYGRAPDSRVHVGEALGRDERPDSDEWHGPLGAGSRHGGAVCRQRARCR